MSSSPRTAAGRAFRSTIAPAPALELAGDELLGVAAEALAASVIGPTLGAAIARVARADVPTRDARRSIGAPRVTRRAPSVARVLASARTFALLGVEAREVTVEVDVAPRPARVRDRRAARRRGARVARAGARRAHQLGVRVPACSGSRPASRRPTCARPGPGFDLAIAAALLAATGQLAAGALDRGRARRRAGARRRDPAGPGRPGDGRGARGAGRATRIAVAGRRTRPRRRSLGGLEVGPARPARGARGCSAPRTSRRLPPRAGLDRRTAPAPRAPDLADLRGQPACAARSRSPPRAATAC